jgi:hypothetical protein
VATRKVRHERALKTQALLANLLRERGYPHAESVGSGRPGRDVLNTPGISVEVKATAGTPTVEALKQAERAAADDVPMVVYRPPGFGPEKILDWPVTMRLSVVLELLRKAGITPDSAAGEG